MADNSNKRLNDRREGRLLRSLSAFARLSPYVQTRRSAACSVITESVEVSAIEQWIREKRGEGWANIGFLHLMAAAYVRTVSMRPGINRFVAGRRIYARSDIQLVLTVKRGATPGAAETGVKVSLSPADSVFDVYRKISEAVDGVHAEVTVNAVDRIASTLLRLPRFVTRFVMAVLRKLDYFDILPFRMLEASPFHGSLRLTDLGSLGIAAAETHLSDFGTLPMALCFGAKRRAEGDRHFVDYRIVVDDRIADAFYFSGALKCLKYFLKNPALLELPPESVEDDVN